MSPATTTRRRQPQARGDRARQAILHTAMARATVDGLDGLSLGQLAGHLGVSKAGLFAHFASKEDLQLATVDYARERFTAAVVDPALAEPSRLRRLLRVHELKLAWIAAPDPPGGCFFINAQFEFSARPGPVHDRLAEVVAEWLDLLAHMAASAVRAGELRPATDPRLVAFELDSYQVAAVYRSRLAPDPTACAMARAAGLRRLRELATDPSLLPEA
jgi:AcrR family transcriptional regulator